MTRPLPDATPGSGPAVWFPMMVDLRRRPVLVVGGGDVAAAKVHQLLESHARVTVVSPELVPRLAGWHREGRIEWRDRRFRREDVAGAFLVFAATDEPDVNRVVSEAAESASLPVNAADDPANCSFTLPAVHRSGPLTVTVSTAGIAPALAVRLRDRIARELDLAHAPYLALLGSLRDRIKDRLSRFDDRRRVWYRMVDDPRPLALVRRGDLGAAERILTAILDEAAPPADAETPCSNGERHR